MLNVGCSGSCNSRHKSTSGNLTHKCDRKQLTRTKIQTSRTITRSVIYKYSNYRKMEKKNAQEPYDILFEKN